MSSLAALARRRLVRVGGTCVSPHNQNRRHASSFTALILGAPGGGKGTIGRYLVRDFGFAHVSTGDLLRRHVLAGTPVGASAKRYVERGELVPDDVMVSLVAAETASPSSPPRRLLDGFPRTLAQAERLAHVLHVDCAVVLDVPRDVLVRRLADRWVHDASGRTYAYDFNPPKVHGRDDDTGEPLVRRPDDEPDVVRARLKAFDDNLRPILDFYAAQGVLASFQGEESMAIYADLFPFFEARLRGDARPTPDDEEREADVEGDDFEEDDDTALKSATLPPAVAATSPSAAVRR